MFTDRSDAGRRLARRLQHLKPESPVVLGLPRGGVPVALEVALALDAPLDVIVVRKLGAPFQPELAMGAIGEGNVRIVNEDVARMAHISENELIAADLEERHKLERRVRQIRGERAPVELAGRTVVIIDDGVATGSTAQAACQVARARGANRVVLAVPVAPSFLTKAMSAVADEMVCLEPLDGMFAISQAYADFTQVSDEEVVACLEQQRPKATASGGSRHGGDIDVAAERAGEEARGVELFAVPATEESIVVAREEAEGYELFEDPADELPVEALVEGAPGHESLSGDDLGLGRDVDNNRREGSTAR